MLRLLPLRTWEAHLQCTQNADVANINLSVTTYDSVLPSIFLITLHVQYISWMFNISLLLVLVLFIYIVQMFSHMHTHTHLYIYISVYIVHKKVHKKSWNFYILKLLLKFKQRMDSNGKENVKRTRLTLHLYVWNF